MYFYIYVYINIYKVYMNISIEIYVLLYLCIYYVQTHLCIYYLCIHVYDQKEAQKASTGDTQSFTVPAHFTIEKWVINMLLQKIKNHAASHLLSWDKPQTGWGLGFLKHCFPPICFNCLGNKLTALCCWSFLMPIWRQDNPTKPVQHRQVRTGTSQVPAQGP